MSNNELINSIDEQALANIMSKRHKLARAQFKNPPQPKFCIRERTTDGQECFINVLSYSRIANKLSEYDPIPLYGGMQIRSFSSIKNPLQIQQQHPNQAPTNSQLIFAVMASPEVLKKSGRNQMDNPEQLSLVELMCEFVEAMNPGIVLTKKPEVLPDRDLAGELKDVWSAVQNFRDRERAAVSDIVVYTEFGPAPDSKTSSVIESKSPKKNESDNKFNDSEKSESKVDECDASQITTTSDNETCETSENAEEVNSDKIPQLLSPTKINTSATLPVEVEPPPTPPITDVQKIEIEKLTISSSESKKTSSAKNNNANHNNESSEKIVKIQNQKNKESSKESFLPKLFSSNKDKEKEKVKVKDEPEVKTKTKKSLIFFRRSKSTTSSPTHATTNDAAADKNEDDN